MVRMRLFACPVNCSRLRQPVRQSAVRCLAFLLDVARRAFKYGIVDIGSIECSLRAFAFNNGHPERATLKRTILVNLRKSITAMRFENSRGLLFVLLEQYTCVRM